MIYLLKQAAAAGSAVMEAVNHSKNSAMEAENHVKHRRSSKSHSSRGNFWSFFGVVAIVLSVAVVTSCGDDDENGGDENNQNKYIHVDNNTRDALNQTLYADETEGKSLTFTTTGEWTSKITPTEASSWVSISPSSGSDAKTYTVSVSLLINSTDTERKADITISCHGEEVTIKVTHTARTQDGRIPLLSWDIGEIPGTVFATLNDGTLTISGTGKMKDLNYPPWNDHVNDITSVDIVNGVTSIGHMAFYEHSNIASVTIPNSVTVIEGAAFASCTGLTSIIIPQNVTEIKTKAFVNCSGLISFTIFTPVPPRYAMDAFFTSDPITYCTLFVPQGSIEAYRGDQGWGLFVNIEAIEE